MLKELKEIVRGVLKDYEDNRNNDEKLYVTVITRLGVDPQTITLEDFYLYGSCRWGLPSIETVSRLRRKLQEEDATLRADKSVREMRRQRCEMFKAHFKCPKRYKGAQDGRG